MENVSNALQALLESSAHQQESLGYTCTAAEIAGQPEVWRKTRETVAGVFPALSNFCSGADRLLLTGAGSSYFAAVSIAGLLRARFRCVEAMPSTEILMDPESCFPREPFLLVSIARSGNSPEGNAVFALAGQLRPGKVKHLVITCSRDGELARLVDGEGSRGFKLLLPEESNDRGLAMTGSFSSLTIAGYALGFQGALPLYRTTVQGLARAAAILISRGSDLADALAREGFTRVFFIASPPGLGGALEAHLKVQELSGGRVLAKAEDTLGFRHGFMAAVDGNSLVVLSLSRDPCRRLYEMDLLSQIRGKGLGKKVVVTAEEEAGRGAPGLPADGSFSYPADAPVTDAVRAPLVAITGQLLGLFISLQEGLRPDNPSPSGVIHRVVQGVRIHPPSP